MEELSDNFESMLNQQHANPNDKYKSQNCRQFYRDKFCLYGKRCHFRHEYRTFKKIHRHHYMAHLAAMNITFEDIITESKQKDVSVCKEETSCESSDLGLKGASDISTDSGSADLSEESLEAIPQTSRLSVFHQITCDESEEEEADKLTEATKLET